jgi:hypothetical protein
MRRWLVWTSALLLCLAPGGLAMAADRYRFGTPKDTLETYASGDEVPHREQSIERQRPDGSWEKVGYIELHLHKVIRDATDLEDISVGVTTRINPKRASIPRDP